jgi:hypothetical protein
LPQISTFAYLYRDHCPAPSPIFQQFLAGFDASSSYRRRSISASRPDRQMCRYSPRLSGHPDRHLRAHRSPRLANISPPDRFLVVLIPPLQSARPSNSKNSHFILFLTSVSSTRIAELSLFDAIPISQSIDTTFFNPADTSINQKVRPWSTDMKLLLTHYALPSPSRISKYCLFHRVRIRQTITKFVEM